MSYAEDTILQKLIDISNTYSRKLKFLCDNYDSCINCPLEGINCKDLNEVVCKLSDKLIPHSDYDKHIDIITSELLEDKGVLGFYYVVPKNTLYSEDVPILYAVLKNNDDVSSTLTKTLEVRKTLGGYFNKLKMLVEVEVYEEEDIVYIINKLKDYKYDSLKMYGGVSYEGE